MVKTYTCDKCGDTREFNSPSDKAPMVFYHPASDVAHHLCPTCHREFKDWAGGMHVPSGELVEPCRVLDRSNPNIKVNVRGDGGLRKGDVKRIIENSAFDSRNHRTRSI